MWTPGSLAARRIRTNLRFQIRAWRMAIDWTVALYLVVPGLFFAGYQYVSWWNEPPFWLKEVPDWLVRSYLYLFAAAGTVRFFVEEADQLFLVQRDQWFRRMMAGGAVYSLVKHALWTALTGMALYPLLSRVYGLGPAAVAALFLLTYLFKIHFMLGKQYLTVRIHGWRSILLRLILFPLLGAAFGLLTALPYRSTAAAYVVALALALPLIWLLPARLRLRGAFYQDIRREQQEKMKVAGLIMSAGGIRMPKKAKLRRKHPLLFPGSARLFRVRSPENVLAESLMKAAFRANSKLSLMGYAALAYATAVAASPAGLRWIVWLIVSALYCWMAKGFAKDGASEAYVRLFHWEDGVRTEAFWKAGTGLALPGCLIFALLTGILQLGPIQGMLMLPAGAAAAWAGSRIFGLTGV